MNILVIDDDVLFSELFIKDISLFFYKYNSNLNIINLNHNFKNIDYNNNFRFVFIDIDLKEINGIQLSKTIKQYNPHCYIVFISAKNNLIHSSLCVQPFFFIRKENYSDDLHLFFELIKESLSNKTMISSQDIIYIESVQHILNIYTINGVYKDNRTLKEFLTLLPINQFIQIHRAFIVNCLFVYSISKGYLCLHKPPQTLNKDVIQLRISRSYQKQFEDRYQEYLLL